MAKAKAWEVTDDFWNRVEPLIPVRQRVADQDVTVRDDQALRICVSVFHAVPINLVTSLTSASAR